MEDGARDWVECATHGAQAPAFVCVHLIPALHAGTVRHTGFVEADVQPDEGHAAESCGWCETCETVRAQEGGWNDRSEQHAQVKLVCEACFERLRQLACVASVVAALAVELERTPRALAALFFGSAQRGRLEAHSDLDFYVLVDGDERWREGRMRDDLPLELSFSPARYLAQRLREHSPVVAHALATGEILFDRTGELAALVSEARRLWAAGPPPASDAERLRWRFRLTDLFHDLCDLGSDGPDAAAVAALLVQRAVEAACACRGTWLPPRKQMVEALHRDQPELAPLVERYYTAPGVAAALSVGEHVLDDLGGLLVEYRTEPSKC